MKALYDKDGILPVVEVDLIAYDWDKYVTFKTVNGEIHTDKLWKFDVKRSNKLYHLAKGYGDEVINLSRKEVAKLLKEERKHSTEYTVELVTSAIKHFRSLKKALNFCKGCSQATDLHGNHKAKRRSCFTGVLVKEDGDWFYFTRQEFVSEVTLNRFCTAD